MYIQIGVNSYFFQVKMIGYRRALVVILKLNKAFFPEKNLIIFQTSDLNLFYFIALFMQV